MIDFLLTAFAKNPDDEAVVWRDASTTYGWLSERVEAWRRRLSDDGVAPGSVVSLESDFNPESIAALLALIERSCLVVPLTPDVEAKKDDYRAIAQVERMARIGGTVEIPSTGLSARHDLYVELRRRGHPGLVLFSSGSTGKSKAAVHDFAALLEKFHTRRPRYRTLAFLLFDHIGGMNTLLHTLSNGGCLVTVEDRTPDAVCRTIERHRVELLPTSPTFINLLIVGEAYRRHDLSSLKVVTYGTEVMPESTLRRMHEIMPSVALRQTYGLSELGILRAHSKSSDSLWVKVGGEGYETRVRNGIFEIKARTAMLGYLNAPSPITEDGWFTTGDTVETDGEYVRFLGRASEIVNVGGRKVYPAEVESALQEMPGVEECSVSGEPNPFTGQIVTARIKLSTEESTADFSRRMWAFCGERLERYKIPQKVTIEAEGVHNERFKKMRLVQASHRANAEG